MFCAEGAVLPVAAVPPLPVSRAALPCRILRYGATEGNHFPSVVDHPVTISTRNCRFGADEVTYVRSIRVGQGGVELSVYNDATMLRFEM